MSKRFRKGYSQNLDMKRIHFYIVLCAVCVVIFTCLMIYYDCDFSILYITKTNKFLFKLIYIYIGSLLLHRIWIEKIARSKVFAVSVEFLPIHWSVLNEPLHHYKRSCLTIFVFQHEKTFWNRLFFSYISE